MRLYMYMWKQEYNTREITLQNNRTQHIKQQQRGEHNTYDEDTTKYRKEQQSNFTAVLLTKIWIEEVKMETKKVNDRKDGDKEG